MLKRCMGVFLGLAVIFAQGKLHSQEKDPVTLQVVKYDGLKEAVLKNLGKVVVVDFWFMG